MSASERLRQATGLDLDQATVARALKRRMQAHEIDAPDRYEALLDGAELAALIEEVVVPESWMFRDPEAFTLAAAFLRERSAGGRARILSLPCAGGEEPYSLAMALEDAGVAREAYRIDAVDLSAASLARARAGRYTRNAFRGPAQDYQQRYFTRDHGGFQILPWLRQQVNFIQASILDYVADAHVADVHVADAHVADAHVPGLRYDVIFCRNLLIYFDEPTGAAAIARLDQMLEDDGMLFAGYAEVPAFIRHGFEVVRAPGAFALTKAAASVAPAALPGRAQLAPQPARNKLAAAPAPHAAAPAPARVPSDPAALLARAERAADAGQLADAARLCHAMLETDPNIAQAWFILGLTGEASGDITAADASYRRCVYLQPDHYEALCHLALLCEAAGDATQGSAFRQRAARIYARRAGAAS